MEGPISCCSFILLVIFGICAVRLSQSENMAQNRHVAKCAAIRFVSLRLSSLKGILGSHTVCISNLDLKGEVFFWVLHLTGMLLFFFFFILIFSMSNNHFTLEGFYLFIYLSVCLCSDYAELNLRGS